MFSVEGEENSHDDYYLTIPTAGRPATYLTLREKGILAMTTAYIPSGREVSTLFYAKGKESAHDDLFNNPNGKEARPHT